MMYYIDTINTWKASNRKCSEIQEFVRQYENCLVKDDLSRDALVEEIQHKVDELNTAYPRTGKVVVRMSKECHVSCATETKSFDDKYVLTFRFCPVRRTYRFNERVPMLRGDEENAAEVIREQTINVLADTLRIMPFTVDFEVKEKPDENIKVIYEVTQEHMNEIMQQAMEGGKQ